MRIRFSDHRFRITHKRSHRRIPTRLEEGSAPFFLLSHISQTFICIPGMRGFQKPTPWKGTMDTFIRRGFRSEIRKVWFYGGHSRIRPIGPEIIHKSVSRIAKQASFGIWHVRSVSGSQSCDSRFLTRCFRRIVRVFRDLGGLGVRGVLINWGFRWLFVNIRTRGVVVFICCLFGVVFTN